MASFKVAKCSALLFGFVHILVLICIPPVSSILSTPYPSDVTVSKNDPASFICTASSTDPLIWSKYSQMKKSILYRGLTKLTTSDPAKYQVTNSSGVYNLTILNAEESDAGSYSCSTEALDDEHGVNLVVISSLEATVTPNNDLQVGMPCTIECSLMFSGPSATSFKPLTLEQHPKLLMSIGGQQQDVTGEIEVSPTSTSYQITLMINRTVAQSDVGEFVICTATSTTTPPFPSAVAGTILNIWTPTSMVHISVKNDTIYDTNQMINCTADGYPPPTVVWTLLSPQSGCSNTGDHAPGYAVLKLGSSCSGSFTWNCSAKNSSNQVMASSIVTFQVGPGGGTSAPSSDKNNNVGLGVGLGIGLGVPILLAIIILIVVCMKRKQQRQGSEDIKKPPPNIDPKKQNNPPPKPANNNGVPVNPNPNPIYPTPVFPEQVSNTPQRPVRGSPGVPDLGVRHLGGSGSIPQLNESFDSSQPKRNSNDLLFRGGFADLGQGGPNTSV